MVAKIGFVLLVLISCGALYLLDYYLKQDQEDNSQQLHSFVQHTRELAQSKIDAKEKFEIQVTSELAHCQEKALKTYNAYIVLIQNAAPVKHGLPVIPQTILDDASMLLTDENAECKKTYDAKLRESF